MSGVVLNRTCNGCTACCKTHAVDEVNSLGGRWCKHCNIGKGCLIYNRRPKECRLYECIWLKGKGGDSDRPDRLKIVMDINVVNLDKQEIVVLNLWEVEGDAASQARVCQITKANLEQGNVVRHRLLVPSKVSKSGVLDRIFFPERRMFTKKSKQRFLKAIKHI